MSLNQDRNQNIYLDTMKKLDLITWKEIYLMMISLPNSAATQQRILEQMMKITTPRKQTCFELLNHFIKGETESLINGFEIDFFNLEDVLYFDTILPGFLADIIKLLLQVHSPALTRLFIHSSIQQSGDFLVKSEQQKKF